MRALVRGTGMYVPPNIVDNHRMALLMDTSHDWIERRTGIHTRHFADLDQASSDLAVEAARQALDDAGMDKREIDYVIVATMTPDFYFPGSAAILQRKLDLGHIPCLDIRQQCTGFLHGLQLAHSLVQSGQYRNVLLVGAEVHGGFMPFKSWDVLLGESDREVPEDEFGFNTRFRDRVVLFGDGAGAFVISRGEDDGKSGIEDIRLHTDGSYADRMWVPAGGSAFRPYFSPSMFEEGHTVPIVQGREVFKLAVTMMPEVVQSILGDNGHTLEELDLLVMHQANLRINEAVQDRLNLPSEKVYNNIQKYGNTTAATLPMAYHEARTERNLKPGDLVCLVALGSGVTWGAGLYHV